MTDVREAADLRSLLGSVSYMSIAQVAGFALRFINGLLLTRLLGADAFGVYVLAFSIAELFTVLATLGLNTVSARYLPEYRATGDTALLRGLLQFVGRSTLSAAVIAALLGTAGSAMLVESPDLKHALTTVFLSVLIPQVWLTVRQGVLQGMSYPTQAQLPGALVRPLALTVLLLAMVGLGDELSLNTAIWLTAISLLIATGIIEILYRSRAQVFAGTDRDFATGNWAKSAASMLGIALLTYFNSQSMVLLLGYFSDASSVGVFSVASRIALLVAFFNAMANNAFAPRFGQLWAAHGPGEMIQGLVTRIVSIVSVASLAVCLLIYVFGSEILSLFGAEFIAGEMPLQMLLFGQLVNVLSGAVAMMLTMAGQEKLVFRALGIGALVSVVLGLALIPLYDVDGAALATTAGLIVWNVLLWYQVRKRLSIAPSVFRI